MFLEDSQLKLRALEPEDLEQLYAWENDTALWLLGNTLSPYSKLALRQYINDSLEMDIYQSKQLRLMIDLHHNSNAIGTIDLYEIDARNRRAGVGILIDKAFRKNNYAYQTLTLMNQYAFDFLDLHQLYAYIPVTNEASLRLFEKVGYEVAGTLKDWIQLSDDTSEDVIVVQAINK